MLRSFPRVDVFIAHNSPRGIHERDDDVHQGFDGFLEYVEKRKPQHFLHGHQHLNGITQHGNTKIIGIFGEALVELA
jgi:Icc-related predicted phosphoesterase